MLMRSSNTGQHRCVIISGIFAWLSWSILLILGFLLSPLLIVLAVTSQLLCVREGSIPTNLSLDSLHACEQKMMDTSGLEFTRVEEVNLPCGIKARVLITEPPTGGPKRVPIVFVHGLATDACFSWLGTMKWAEKHGMHIVCVDLPGFGNVEAPPGARNSVGVNS